MPGRWACFATRGQVTTNLMATMRLLTCLATLALSGFVPAQEIPEPVRRLSALVGTWKGEGWVQFGPQKQTSEMTEKVEARLGGRVLIIDGLGLGKDESNKGEPVHQAFGVISWDAQQSRLAMRAVTVERGSVDADIAWDGDKLVWGFTTPMGRVRYTATFTATTWHEVGEFQRGDQWLKIMEMTLTKQP